MKRTSLYESTCHTSFDSTVATFITEKLWVSLFCRLTTMSGIYLSALRGYPISNAILGQPCYNIVGSWKPIPILSQYLYNVHTILAWVSILNNIQILLSNIGTILYQHCMIQYLHCMTQCLHCVLQDIFIIQEKNSKCTNSWDHAGAHGFLRRPCWVKKTLLSKEAPIEQRRLCWARKTLLST